MIERQRHAQRHGRAFRALGGYERTPGDTLQPVDDRVRRAVHERWGERLNRRTDDPGYLEEWYFQQCGGCLHWLALGGALGAEWGVCSARESAYDGVARFEHDGCDHFAEDPEGFGITRG
jgi:hypothetical protein